ncbi:MAG: hypothetical protein WCW78_02000 [Candidatus Paceibacterota bacterium]|jgi:hypothetical protein
MTSFYFEQQENSIVVHAKTDVAINAWSGVVEITNTDAIATISTNDDNGMIWKTTPTVEAGRGIVFAGGIPNGFIGDNILFRFTLSAPIPTLSFSTDSTLYLNNGKGTEVFALKEPFVMNANVRYTPSHAVSDMVPPESFTPELYRDASLFDGSPVVIFSTRDMNSGVQRYEVREVTEHGLSVWRSAQSPYRVNPDVIKLEIRAYDNAGNIRTEVVAVNVSPSYVQIYALLISAVIIVLLMVYTSIHTWKKRF